MDKDREVRSLDLRSLRILVLLLSECSVTRTAEMLGQPQPAVSVCLARLRRIFGDPLLVRSGNGLAPTDRGKALRVSMGRILADLDRELTAERSFDPAAGEPHFKLLMSNCFGPAFVADVIRGVRERSPGAVVDMSPMPAFEQVAPLVTDGAADIALGNWPSPPRNMRVSPLFASDIVALAHRDHPFARLGRLDLARYLRAQHLSLTPSGNAAMSPIDGRLGEMGLSRRIAASTPDYGSVPYVLARTDLVFTTSRHFAAHALSLAPLALLELPESFGSIVFHALWHERDHRSPAHIWLRDLLKSLCRGVTREPLQRPALAAV